MENLIAKAEAFGFFFSQAYINHLNSLPTLPTFEALKKELLDTDIRRDPQPQRNLFPSQCINANFHSKVFLKENSSSKKSEDDIILPGPIVLQVTSLANITLPPKRKLEESFPRMLSIGLTDGYTKLTGIELGKISNLKANFAPGFKVLYSGGEITRGKVILNDSNCKVLGGHVSYLAEAHQANLTAQKYRSLFKGVTSTSKKGSSSASTVLCVTSPPKFQFELLEATKSDQNKPNLNKNARDFKPSSSSAPVQSGKKGSVNAPVPPKNQNQNKQPPARNPPVDSRQNQNQRGSNSKAPPAPQNKLSRDTSSQKMDKKSNSTPSLHIPPSNKGKKEQNIDINASSSHPHTKATPNNRDNKNKRELNQKADIFIPSSSQAAPQTRENKNKRGNDEPSSTNPSRPVPSGPKGNRDQAKNQNHKSSEASPPLIVPPNPPSSNKNKSKNERGNQSVLPPVPPPMVPSSSSHSVHSAPPSVPSAPKNETKKTKGNKEPRDTNIVESNETKGKKNDKKERVNQGGNNSSDAPSSQPHPQSENKNQKKNNRNNNNAAPPSAPSSASTSAPTSGPAPKKGNQKESPANADNEAKPSSNKKNSRNNANKDENPSPADGNKPNNRPPNTNERRQKKIPFQAKPPSEIPLIVSQNKDK